MKITSVKNMLMAQNMERAVRFYVTTFALELRIKGESRSELAWGESIIALHGGHDGTEKRTSLSLEVDDIMDATGQVQLNGGHILETPEERGSETLIYAEFMDTEGNVVMLTQPIGA